MIIIFIIYLIGFFLCGIIGGCVAYNGIEGMLVGLLLGLVWPILIIITPIRRLVNGEWWWEE